MLAHLRWLVRVVAARAEYTETMLAKARAAAALGVSLLSLLCPALARAGGAPPLDPSVLRRAEAATVLVMTGYGTGSGFVIGTDRTWTHRLPMRENDVCFLALAPVRKNIHR